MLQGYADIELFVQQVLVVFVLAIWLLQSFEDVYKRQVVVLAFCVVPRLACPKVGLPVSITNIACLLYTSHGIRYYINRKAMSVIGLLKSKDYKTLELTSESIFKVSWTGSRKLRLQ